VASAAAGDTINFDPTLSCPPASPIMLANGTLFINGLTIDGPGAATMAVSGGGSVEVFETAGQVGISGLTIENGSHPNNVGGGIDNEGTLTLTDSTVSGSSASAAGGGIYNTGNMTLVGSTVPGNSTVLFGGGIENTGTMTVTDSTVSGNTSDSFGGGISNGDSNIGTMTVTDSTVSGNTSDNFGGGRWPSGPAARTPSPGRCR
jgi:hypothetical protein